MTVTAALTRRRLLQAGALLPLAALVYGCDKAGTTQCADPGSLSRGEEQMRKKLLYVEVSSNALQSCANCQFFSAVEPNGCGHCEILDGVVNQKGFCTSWTQHS